MNITIAITDTEFFYNKGVGGGGSTTIEIVVWGEWL